MKEELFITVEGFKKFCDYFDIKINEKNIEIIKEIERRMNNEKVK